MSALDSGIVQQWRQRAVTWFDSLEPRDQRGLRWGAAAAIPIVLLGLLLPLQRKVNAAEQLLSQRRADLAWLHVQAPALATLGPADSGATHQSLVVLIDQSARQAGLGKALGTSQPSGNDSISVHLQEAPFDSLVNWVSALQTQHRVQVQSANIDAAATPGTVNATLTFHAH